MSSKLDETTQRKAKWLAEQIDNGQTPNAKAPGGFNDGVDEFCCLDCRKKITRGPSGVEYGHGRGLNGSDDGRCPHRPSSVDPSGSWSGPDQEKDY